MNAPGLPQNIIFSVSQITDLIKEILETSFRSIIIEGEISNWRPSAAGHIYFTLKDNNAQIKAELNLLILKHKLLSQAILPTEKKVLQLIFRQKPFHSGKESRYHKKLLWFSSNSLSAFH